MKSSVLLTWESRTTSNKAQPLIVRTAIHFTVFVCVCVYVWIRFCLPDKRLTWVAKPLFCCEDHNKNSLINKASRFVFFNIQYYRVSIIVSLL